MKKILLAEDDSFLGEVYSMRLQKEGFQVELARDGQAAVDKAQKLIPDLVLLDINLPKLNGCQVLRALRNNEATKKLKVVIVSNLNLTDLPESISGLEYSKYFLKVESTPEEITAYVKELLA